MRVEKWAQERDEMFKRSLGQLKTDILRANSLVQEANFLAEEMEKQTKFSVTLQIPPNNLSPNRKVRISFFLSPLNTFKNNTLNFFFLSQRANQVFSPFFLPLFSSISFTLDFSFLFSFSSHSWMYRVFFSSAVLSSASRRYSSRG